METIRSIHTSVVLNACGDTVSFYRENLILTHARRQAHKGGYVLLCPSALHGVIQQFCQSHSSPTILQQRRGFSETTITSHNITSSATLTNVCLSIPQRFMEFVTFEQMLWKWVTVKVISPKVRRTLWMWTLCVCFWFLSNFVRLTSLQIQRRVRICHDKMNWPSHLLQKRLQKSVNNAY